MKGLCVQAVLFDGCYLPDTLIAGNNASFPEDGALLAVSLQASSGLTPDEYLEEMRSWGTSRRQWGGFLEVATLSRRFHQGHKAFWLTAMTFSLIQWLESSVCTAFPTNFMPWDSKVVSKAPSKVWEILIYYVKLKGLSAWSVEALRVSTALFHEQLLNLRTM